MQLDGSHYSPNSLLFQEQGKLAYFQMEAKKCKSRNCGRWGTRPLPAPHCVISTEALKCHPVQGPSGDRCMRTVSVQHAGSMVIFEEFNESNVSRATFYYCEKLVISKLV